MKIVKYLQKLGLIITLPFLAGCGGGGGGGLASLGSLFSNTSVFQTLLKDPGPNIDIVVTPEPASMLLMGSGLIALSYFKKKMK